MKKSFRLAALLTAALLVLTALTASAEQPVAQIVTTKSPGWEQGEGFDFYSVSEMEAAEKEYDKVGEVAAKEGVCEAAYFPWDIYTSEEDGIMVPMDLLMKDLPDMIRTEYIPLHIENYDPQTMGGLTAYFNPIREYELGQRHIPVLVLFNGEKNEDGSFVAIYRLIKGAMIADKYTTENPDAEHQLFKCELTRNDLSDIQSYFAACIIILTYPEGSGSRKEAFAEGTGGSGSTPSRTSGDVAEIVSYESTKGVLTDNFVVEVVEPINHKPPVVAEINQIAEELKQGKAPLEHFPEDFVQENLEKISLQLDLDPEEFSKLELNEVISVRADNYATTMGDIVARFQTVTPYKVKQRILPIQALYTGKRFEDGSYEVEYIVMKGSIVANEYDMLNTETLLEVVFREEDLVKMDKEDYEACCIYLLSYPEEEE